MAFRHIRIDEHSKIRTTEKTFWWPVIVMAAMALIAVLLLIKLT